MTTRIGAIGVGLIVLILLLSAAVAYSRIPAGPQALESILVFRTDIIRRVSLNGSVVPGDRITVSAPVPLRVLKLRVQLGERVRQGQVLAELDRSSLELELVKRQAAHARAELSLSKVRAVDAESPGKADQDVTLDRRLKTLELREATLELERVQSLLRNCILRSPKGGELVGLAAREGEMTGPSVQGAPAFVIATSESLEIDLEADEVDASHVSVGQRAMSFIDAWSSSPMIGQVSSEPRLRRAASPLSGPALFGISVRMEARPPRLRFGSSARVEVETGLRRQVPAVPLRAVLTNEAGDYVIEVAGVESFRIIPVQLGLSDQTFIELEKGPSVGSRVLVGEAEQLRAFARGLSGDTTGGRR